MFDRKELKERAKAVLLRSYSRIFLACLVVNLLSGGGVGTSARKLREVDFTAMPLQKIILAMVIIVAICVIAAALSVFVFEPLNVGLKKFMTENAKYDAPLNLLLAPFGENYKNIVIVQFIKNLFVFLWSLPAVLPTVAAVLLFGNKLSYIEDIQQGSVLAALEVSGVILVWLLITLVFSIPSIIKELQYVMVPYILADNLEIEWRDALSESKEMMVGNKWAYIKLMISFVPWYLAANLLCCVGGFLVTPYVEATVCELYLELSGKNLVNAEYEQ